MNVICIIAKLKSNETLFLHNLKSPNSDKQFKTNWQHTNREHRYKYTGDNGEDGRNLEGGGDKHKDRRNGSGCDTKVRNIRATGPEREAVIGDVIFSGYRPFPLFRLPPVVTSTRCSHSVLE
jgi:hypothetical protein